MFFKHFLLFEKCKMRYFEYRSYKNDNNTDNNTNYEYKLLIIIIIEFAVILKINLFTIEKYNIVIIRVSNVLRRRTAPLFVPILMPRHFVFALYYFIKLFKLMKVREHIIFKSFKCTIHGVNIIHADLLFFFFSSCHFLYFDFLLWTCRAFSALAIASGSGFESFF